MDEISSEMTTKEARIRNSLLWIGLAVILADQAVKWWAYAFLPVIDSGLYLYPYGGIGIFHNWAGIEFSLNHMTNTGAAWGILGSYQIPLLTLRIALIIGLIIYLFYYKPPSKWQVPLMLIIAGAASNVFDYFIYGHVVDMFHFVLWGYDFPVFNLADSSITIGIAALFFFSWFP